MWTKDDINRHFTEKRIPDHLVYAFVEEKKHRVVGDWVEKEFIQHSNCIINLGPGVDLPQGFNGDSNPYEIKTREVSAHSYITVGAYSKNTIEQTDGVVCLDKLTTNLIYITWCKKRGIVVDVKFINNNTNFVKEDVKNQLAIAANKIKTMSLPAVHSKFFAETEFPFIFEYRGDGMIAVRISEKQLQGRSSMAGMLFDFA
jgi:hypothetical protein